MTAVEWLKQNLPNLGEHIPFGVSMELHAKFQQALEMEWQQIIDAHVTGHNASSSTIKQHDAEQYYNETYKKDNL
jgi:hypothetical protein